VTIKELDRANKLHQEIEELEGFINTASKVWRGKLIQKKRRFIFKTVSYGWFDAKEYDLNTEAKNEVLKVLQARLLKLKIELDQLGTEATNETL